MISRVVFTVFGLLYAVFIGGMFYNAWYREQTRRMRLEARHARERLLLKEWERQVREALCSENCGTGCTRPHDYRRGTK